MTGSVAHQIVVALTGMGALALIAGRRRLRARDDRTLRRILAAFLAGNELLSWVIGLGRGQFSLPLQLCDLALAMTVWGLLSLRPLVCELAYCWALAGSVQAVVTPDLSVSFPDDRWVQFFVGHCGVVLSAVYLASSGRVRPTPWSVWRTWFITNGYAVIAGVINGVAGTNLGYLARKPMHPSLLDLLGPWPWYIVGMELMALALLFLALLPLTFKRISQ